MKEQRDLIKMMKKRGWRFSRTGSNHLSFRHWESGAIVTTSGTPSDTRARKNFIARVNRIEREHASQQHPDSRTAA